MKEKPCGPHEERIDHLRADIGQQTHQAEGQHVPAQAEETTGSGRSRQAIHSVIVGTSSELVREFDWHPFQDHLGLSMIVRGAFYEELA